MTETSTVRIPYQEFHHCGGFEFAHVANGFVFREYSIATDSYRTRIAKTPDELAAIALDWAENLARDLKAWAVKQESA